MIWGKICGELFCGWMVEVVQLFESGCYEAKSVLCCYVAEWWIWLSSGRVGVMGQSLWKGLCFGGMVSLWH